jgi:hypothetical protein
MGYIAEISVFIWAGDKQRWLTSLTLMYHKTSKDVDCFTGHRFAAERPQSRERIRGILSPYPEDGHHLT